MVDGVVSFLSMVYGSGNICDQINYLTSPVKLQVSVSLIIKPCINTCLVLRLIGFGAF